MITQARIKELFVYDPESGIFTYKRKMGRNGPGDTVGNRHNMGYVKIFADGKSYLAHRLAYLYMTGEFPPDQIDHINHLRHDNRWENLRPVGYAQNSKNKSCRRRSRCVIAGVRWRDKRWYVMTYHQGKEIYLGSFPDLFSAVCARRSSDIQYGYHENNGKECAVDY